MSNWGNEEGAVEKLLLVADQYKRRYGNSYREVRQDTKDLHAQAQELLGQSTNPKSETFKIFETLERAILSARGGDRNDPEWTTKATTVLDDAMLVASKYLATLRA